MCGIYGIVFTKETNLTQKKILKLQASFMRQTEKRGKDAAGVAIANNNEISVYKQNISATHLLKNNHFKRYLSNHINAEQNVAIIGHARMITNGIGEIHQNNQPIITDENVVIHNGIIVNQAETKQKFKPLNFQLQTDTEIINKLIQHFSKEKSYLNASQHLFKETQGTISTAILFNNINELLLATNNGSVFYTKTQENSLFCFASEEYMLRKALTDNKIGTNPKIKQLKAGKACFINLSTLNIFEFSLNENHENENNLAYNANLKTISDHSPIAARASIHTSKTNAKAEQTLENNYDAIAKLKRCTKCLLPETFPYIYFDNTGKCNYCKNHQKIIYKGETELQNIAQKHKKNNGKPDVIVPLSGGRDSCFALHYIKNELALTPVAYTYDWGMITDLARRNISRMTAELGVEHVLISANIRKKRENIKKNVTAWLKRPSLGTIPLFMAGDKQFFYYANQLKKQLNTELLVFGMNPLERTDFKVGFTGIQEKKKQNRHYNLSAIDKLKIASYYAKEYFLNPAFINSTLWDTAFAFMSYYMIDHSYKIFYDYFPWNEKTVEETIVNYYSWEKSPDTPTTWRIGDGTAAFYNYIYLTVAGFTENDTFRSNQIRQGIISREEAFQKVLAENKHRFQAIKWYCDTVGLDFERTIKTINNIPKSYVQP